MNFKTLIIKDEQKSGWGPSRMYKGIGIGDFSLSVQASYYHYCTPRETTDLDEYTHMEVAVFHNGEWVNPSIDERFNDFPRIDEIIEMWEPGEIAVGGCIPIDLIQDLYDYIDSNLNIKKPDTPMSDSKQNFS